MTSSIKKNSWNSDILKDSMVFIVLLALIVANWLPRSTGSIDLRWDAGVYYVLGTALAEGKGYKLLNEPGEINAIQYPPLLPALIATQEVIIGTSDPTTVGRWLRLTFFLIFTAYILTTYLFLRKYLPLPYALAAAGICLLNVQTTFLSDVCLSEIPFALASILFVIVNRNPGRIYGVLAAIFATAAYLLRTIGIALFVAWIAESLFQREYKKAALRLIIALIPVLLWQGYIFSVERSPSYLKPAYQYQRADYMFYNVSYTKNISLREPFSPELGKASLFDILKRIAHNLVVVPISLGEAVGIKEDQWTSALQIILPAGALSPVFSQNLISIGLILLGCLVLGGVATLWMKGEILIPVYILATMAALCLTPWPGHWPLYLAPLAPFFALALTECLLVLRRGCKAILCSLAPSICTGSIAAVLGFILATESLSLVQLYRNDHNALYKEADGRIIRLFYYHEDDRASDEALAWLKAHASRGDIVAATMPHWVYLQTGLKTVMPPFEKDLTRANELLDSVPVTYVAVTAFKPEHTGSIVRHARDHWELVYSAPVGVAEIYRRRAEDRFAS